MSFIDKIRFSDKQHFALFAILLTAISAIMVYSYLPMRAGQDYYFHIMRLEALMDAIKEGTFPYYLDYKVIDGYGYFTKAFYCDVILIPFALLGIATSTFTAYNTILFVITLLCGIFTYIAVRKIFENNLAASIAGILYTFCFYRLLDMYHRAALGETISFTFIPIVFLGLYHIIKGDYKKWYIIAIGFSLLIFTHVISTVLTLLTVIVFLIIYNKYLRKEPKRILYLSIAAFSTVLITAYYVFPMLEQMASDTFYYQARELTGKPATAKFGINWVIWGMYTGGVQARQIFVPGVSLLLSAAVCVRLFVLRKTKLLRFADVMVIVGLVYIFMTSVLFPWQYFPFTLLDFIQFPWRLLEFSCFFFAVAGGYYLSLALSNTKRILAALAIIVFTTSFMIVNDAELFKAVRWNNLNAKPTIDNYYFLAGREYIPDAVPTVEYLAERGDTIIAQQQSEISNFSREKNTTSFSIKLNSKEDIVELPLIYYKGYAAYQDNNKLQVTESKNGLVEVNLHSSGHIKVFYEGTVIQTIGFYLSILSIIGLLIFIVYSRRRKYA